MGFLLAIINFFKGSNIKYIMYAIFGVVLFGTIWYCTQLISDNAKNQVVIEQYKKDALQYQQTIADKDKSIKLQQSVIDLNNQAIIERDKTIDDLTNEFSNLVNNDLGNDLNNPAANSLKELIRKLQEKETKGIK